MSTSAGGRPLSADTLCVELQLKIFQFLPKKDLKNVRLTCSQLSGPATEPLFDRIYVSNRQKDLEVLEAWTADEGLRRHIKQIIFDVSSLNPHLPPFEYGIELWQYYENLVSNNYEGCDQPIKNIFKWVRYGKALEKGQTGPIWSRREGRLNGATDTLNGLLEFPLVQASYVEYLQQARFETATRNNGEAFRRLQQTVTDLPKLRCVSLSHERQTLPFVFQSDQLTENKLQRLSLDSCASKIGLDVGSPFVRSWNCMYLPLYYGQHSGLTLDAYRMTIQRERIRVPEAVRMAYRSHTYGDDGSPLPNLGRASVVAQFEFFIKLLSSARHNTQILEIFMSGGESLHLRELTNITSSEVLSPSWTTMLSRLDSLSLRLNVGASKPLNRLGQKEDAPELPGLRTSLQASSNLKNLRLIYHGRNEFLKLPLAAEFDSSKNLPNLQSLSLYNSNLDSSNNLPKLRSLSLSNVTLGTDDFTKFNSQHDLQRLLLSNVELQVHDSEIVDLRRRPTQPSHLQWMSETKAMDQMRDLCKSLQKIPEVNIKHCNTTHVATLESERGRQHAHMTLDIQPVNDVPIVELVMGSHSIFRWRFSIDKNKIDLGLLPGVMNRQL